MIKKTCLFGSYLLIASTIACFSLAAQTDGAASSATDPAVRLKSWEQHVELREESIFKDLKWMPVGPRIQGGKIESIWSVKKRKSTLYAGAGSGNLWKSVNNGTTWKPVFENESTFSVSVVTVSDDDPNLVWVGTGEPHMARSSFAGTGVFKSTDGAKTWKHMGLTDTHHIGRVLIDPKDSNVVYVAALGHQYSYNKQRGVFKTTDGGETWKKVLYISEKVGVVEVAMDPSDNQTLYAVAWERDRKAWNNVVAGPGSGIYKSIDAGETWTLLTKGLPTGEKVGRMGIAIAPSNPNVLYIICDHRGVGGEVYRSDNKGESWRKTHEGKVKTGIGYDFCLIRVLPDNADEIFICGFNLLYSPDAGKTQTSISQRTIPMLSYKARRATPHCDNHDMFIDPDDPDRVMLGTDGGLYISHDRAKTWLHVNTLPIAEFYAISVDAREPYKIWGGTQDNGVLGGEAKPMTPGLEHWEWDLGGDNYVTRIDPNDLDTMYLEGMFGGMARKDLKTGKARGIRPGPAPDGKRLRFNWMTPFILSHYDSKTLYAGANLLFKSENRGDKWTCISPDLSSNPGPDRKGNVPFGTITDISESALKKGLLYAGTDDGQLHVTRDDGATWTKIHKGLPNRWVSRVVASAYDEGTVFASLTGYREDDFEAYLYMSTDYGDTWKSIVNNMPSESVNVIREDPTDKDILYVGTELGAYCSIDKGETWHSLCKTLPTCAVHDLALHAGTGDLVAGTHGRSAFVLHAQEIQKMKQEMAKSKLGTPYGIIVDGKLTKHGAIVGRSNRSGDGKDDKSFILNGLYKFVYAGAGFRSPNARIHARLSVNKLGNTGAGVLVNGHWFTFDIGPGNKIGVTGPAFGKTAKVFAEAQGRIEPGVPFDVDIIVKDGILTYAINGERVGEAKDFPTAMETVPSPDVGSVHKLGLITALRSWRADLKIYEFRVETDGEIVPLPRMQTIYRSGSATTNTYRIPALLLSKKGTILAFAEARRNSGGDTANIDTVVRRSEDGGKTWGDEVIVFDEHDNVAGNPCPVVDQSTGRIWSLQTWNSHKVHENQTKAGFGEDSRRVFVTYSDDDGKTWAKAKDITRSAKQEHWSWYTTGPGAGIQLQRGKHRGRLIIPCDHKSLPEAGPQTYHSHILYSDDHGETWHIGAQTGHGLNECEAVELENGDVMLNSRNHGVNEFYRGVSISKDGGQTFSSFRRDPTLLEPRCQASIRRYRWSTRDKPGIILFSNPARKWRDFLMLRMSYDDGKSWPDARIIFPYTTAYSDIAILSDGRIGVLFERDNHTKIDLAILPALKGVVSSSRVEKRGRK